MGNTASPQRNTASPEGVRKSKRTSSRISRLRTKDQSNDELFKAVTHWGKHYYSMRNFDFIEQTSEISANILNNRKNDIEFMWLPRAIFGNETSNGIGVPIIWANLDGKVYIEELSNILPAMHDFIRTEMNTHKKSYDRTEFVKISEAMKNWRDEQRVKMSKSAIEKGKIVLLDGLQVEAVSEFPLARISVIRKSKFNHNIDIIHFRISDDKLCIVPQSGGTIDMSMILKVFQSEREAIDELRKIEQNRHTLIESKTMEDMENNAERLGIDIQAIKEKARQDGINLCAKTEFTQKIMYLCTQARGQLTPTVAKRNIPQKGRPHSTTKITYNTMDRVGIDILKDMSGDWEEENGQWWWGEIGCTELSNLVGTDLLYRYHKKNEKQIYYASNIYIHWSALSHVADLYFTCVRWTPSADHRHRVIPPLDSNIDKN